VWPPIQTVLVSAVTAALVTLLIEFAAKPRLEARKDRVVEEHRRRRALLARVNALHRRALDFFAAESDAPRRDIALQATAAEFINEFKKLQIDFDKTGYTLRPWQREAFRTCTFNIIFVLRSVEEAVTYDRYPATTIERMRNLGADLSSPGPYSAKMNDLFLKELANAHSSLIPVPWWDRRHRRFMKRLAQRDRDRYR
jgi:hypothetical protein